MKQLCTAHVTLILINVLMVAACVPVQPWERGNLAKPQMAPDPYPPQSSLRAHNYGSREAAAGGMWRRVAVVAVAVIKTFAYRP